LTRAKKASPLDHVADFCRASGCLPIRLFLQHGVDLGDDVLGKLEVVADQRQQFAHCLKLPPGGMRLGLGFSTLTES
jgi:hypothetical protein